MYRGKVTAVDASGVYVQTAEYGCWAMPVRRAAPDPDDPVLVADVGSDSQPDLIVIGVLT